MGGKITQCVKSPTVKSTQLRDFPVALDVGGKHSHFKNATSSDKNDDTDTTRAIISDSSCLSPHLSNDAMVQETLLKVVVICQRGNVMELQTLIESNPSLESYLNETHLLAVSGISMKLAPIQIASCYGQEDLVSYILSFPNVQPNQHDATYGMTALHLAIYLQQRFVVEALCRDGRTNPNEINCEGKSCLQMAIERGNISAVETLFRLKPNINITIRDLNGNTLIHAACVYPNKQLLALLLFCLKTWQLVDENSVDSNQTTEGMNNKKRLPVMIGNRHLFKIPNNSGETPVQILKQSIKLLETQKLTYHKQEIIQLTKVDIKSDDDDHEIITVPTTEDSGLHNSTSSRIFKIMEEERLTLLAEARECMQLLLVEIRTMESFESLSSFVDIQATTETETIASKFRLQLLLS